MSASPLVVAVLATMFGLGELGERPDDSETNGSNDRSIIGKRCAWMFGRILVCARV